LLHQHQTRILILIFIILISYQLILANHIIEGLENNDDYKDYNTNDPNNALILAQQNAGNISYLKKRMDDVQGMYQTVQDLSGNYQSLQDQVNSLVSAQQDYANQMTGGTAPVVTGATSDNNTDDSTTTTTT
jgi:hypothetical protein